MTRTLAGALVAVAALVATGCRSRSTEFYSRVFPCDVAAAADVCGTTSDGEPMTCYSVSALGGTDFCAPACDETSSALLPDGTVCVGAGVSPGARLQACRPAGGAADPAFACPRGLNCYRTDLLKDEGLCLDIPVCNVNEDCPDQMRQVCASSLIRAQFPDAPIPTSNLHCLQAGCSTAGSGGCPPGEACLPEVAPTSGGPDICVPKCDASLRCPPNFVCGRAVLGDPTPAVCYPGIPGNRCAGSQDCMIGACEDSGAGFNICTIPCDTDQGCALLSGNRDPFVCAHPSPGGPGHCVMPNPFAGSPCLLPRDCPSGQDCVFSSPYMRTMSVGECRVPCGPDGECEARGGLPHVCLGDGGCYPGRFGLPCADSSQCIAGFACEAVLNELSVPEPITQPVCTVACSDDDDCDANPWTNKDGYCGGGRCQLAGAPGDPCERDRQCRTGRCQPPVSGSGRGVCLAEPVP